MQLFILEVFCNRKWQMLALYLSSFHLDNANSYSEIYLTKFEILSFLFPIGYKSKHFKTFQISWFSAAEISSLSLIVTPVDNANIWFFLIFTVDIFSSTEISPPSISMDNANFHSKKDLILFLQQKYPFFVVPPPFPPWIMQTFIQK